MTDHEASAFCREKFRQYDQHIQDSPAFRDKVTLMEGGIGWVVKTVESIQKSDLAIKTSLFGIVFAIIVQVCGFVYLWGRQEQTVARLVSDVKDLTVIYTRITK
jgi:hypothetical protein